MSWADDNAEQIALDISYWAQRFAETRGDDRLVHVVVPHGVADLLREREWIDAGGIVDWEKVYEAGGIIGTAPPRSRVVSA